MDDLHFPLGFWRSTSGHHCDQTPEDGFRITLFRNGREEKREKRNKKKEEVMLFQELWEADSKKILNVQEILKKIPTRENEGASRKGWVSHQIRMYVWLWVKERKVFGLQGNAKENLACSSGNFEAKAASLRTPVPARKGMSYYLCSTQLLRSKSPWSYGFGIKQGDRLQNAATGAIGEFCSWESERDITITIIGVVLKILM